MAKRPNSRRNLDIAIERVAGRGPAFVQARTLMADAVVAQMLPDGAVKGGSALKLRFGDAGTRFSEDLDTARASCIDEYIKMRPMQWTVELNYNVCREFRLVRQ